MASGRTRLFGMIAAGLLCAGFGATEVRARAACEPATARAGDQFCQPARRSEAAVDRSGRFQVAQISPFDCTDRCIADFKTCMGKPPANDPGTVQPPPGTGNGTVVTPPGYEFCIGVQDKCIATCKAAAGTNTR
jgi:hypothetical protein